ncbi:MAG: YciI family protein [Hyphomonadaceae bacterium]|nr:YciI family protein [Hyphomonadaceae bacterium]
MLYAVLAYHVEQIITELSQTQDEALMTDLHTVHDRLTAERKLGPAARLGATAKAVTIRSGMVIDGPFAETKEALLGFYVLDCATQEEAIAAAKDLQRVNLSAVYEVRPIPLYLPGVAFPVMAAD